jgi:hypothetical protein
LLIDIHIFSHQGGLTLMLDRIFQYPRLRILGYCLFAIFLSPMGFCEDIFDLDLISIGNHHSVYYGNEANYQIGLWGHATNGDNNSIQSISIHNPQSKPIANGIERNPGGVGCSSAITPVSQLGELAGEYVIAVLSIDGKEEIIKIPLSETDFIKTYPVVSSPAQNANIDPVPVISWPPFVSDERKIVDPNLNQETLTYFISWIHKIQPNDPQVWKQCWSIELYDVPANTPMSVTYNVDGAALPGYESLPTGSYVIDFWCKETSDDRVIDGDTYRVQRAALAAINVSVEGNSSGIREWALY